MTNDKYIFDLDDDTLDDAIDDCIIEEDPNDPWVKFIMKESHSQYMGKAFDEYGGEKVIDFSDFVFEIFKKGWESEKSKK